MIDYTKIMNIQKYYWNLKIPVILNNSIYLFINLKYF